MGVIITGHRSITSLDPSSTPIAPEQTTVAAQAFDVAMASELATKAVDLTNTVSHLPFVG